MSKKVFVSSRLNGELDRERAIASRVISDMGLRPILWENEASLAEHNQEWWRHQINESGLLVLLLHTSISPTVYDEVSTAIQLDKKLAVFCKDIDLISKEKLIPHNWGETVNSKDALEWLYNWLSQHRLNRIDTSFVTTLRDAVADALVFKQTVPHRYLIDNDEIDRIRSLYVPPKKYDQAKAILEQKKLLFLLGPPHIGKTATCLYILAELMTTKSLRSIISCSSRGQLTDIADISKAGVLLDDAFGKVVFDDETCGNECQTILPLAKNNFVVVTSRTDVFAEALTYTRFGEVDIEANSIYLEQEGSYDNDQLDKILDKHLQLALARNVVTSEQVEIANRHRQEILKTLRFPHNIERFAMMHLGQIQRPGDIQLAIRQSREIERAAGQWFKRLSADHKALVISLAICGFQDWDQFNSCRAVIAQLLGIRAGAIPQSMPEISGYISVSNKVAFRHPSYHDGVIREIIRSSHAIVKKLLAENMDSREGRILLSLALREMAEKHPEAVLSLAPVLAMQRPGRVKRHAIIALGKVDKAYSKNAIASLKDITVKGGPVQRRKAALSLSHFVDSEPELVCQALLPLLDDPNHLVRVKVARVFSQNWFAFPSVAFDVLSKLIADENVKVRKEAMIGLEKLMWVFPEEAYRVLSELPEYAMNPKVKWFANKFCLEYEQRLGMVEEANSRIHRLGQDNQPYIQRKLRQMQ